jgi:protein transport protein SEC24
MQIGSLDCDKSIQVEIKYDDKLNDQERVFIQVATLFTSCGGQRRLRIHNITLAITSDYNTMYRSADQNAVFTYLFKQGLGF